VDDAIQLFIKRLSEEISLFSVIIFGSTARGDRLSESDVDLIVVSDDFKNMPLNKRFRLVYMAWPSQIDADILPLTLEEFKNACKKSIIFRDAQKYWKIIKISEK